MAGKKPARSLAARFAAFSVEPPTSSIGSDGGFGVTRTVRPRHSNGSPRPRLAHHLDVLLEQLAALPPLDAGHLELLLAVAEPGDEADAAAADQRDRRELLGESHRVVQRHQDRGDVDLDAFRAPGNRRRERHRRRHEPVVDAVVLGEHDDVEPEPVGPLALVETGLVHRGVRGRRERRHAQIEANSDHAHGGQAY